MFSLHIFIARPFSLSHTFLLVASFIPFLFLSAFLSFSMIQRSSRSSNLAPRRIRRRCSSLFALRAHFTKRRRILGAAVRNARRVLVRLNVNATKLVRADTIYGTRGSATSSWTPKTPKTTGPNERPTFGPATRRSFRSGDRIGPRAAAMTYNNINNDNNTRNTRRAS